MSHPSEQSSAASSAAPAAALSQPQCTTVATSEPSAQSLSWHRAPNSEQSGILGCSHYIKNCKVRAPCCPTFFTCRLCHDESAPIAPGAKEDHSIDRKAINEMVCMLCLRDGRGSRVQPVAERCQDCHEQMASYFCAVCKLFDGNPEHTIFHCADCGIWSAKESKQICDFQSCS
jgi:hypothetical protein